MNKILKNIRRKFDRFRIIAAHTHNGLFHADEVSGTALLLAIVTEGNWESPLPGEDFSKSICRVDVDKNEVTFQSDGHKLHVLRTRDGDLAKDFFRAHEGHMHVTLDVGGEYDVEVNDQLKLDHHQADFEMVQDIDGQEISYSSFGLAWGHLGQPFIERVFGASTEEAKQIHEIVRKRLVAFVDGVDSGTWPYEPDRVYSYSHLISTLMPSVKSGECKKINNAFAKAVCVAYENLMLVTQKAFDRVVKIPRIITSALEEQHGEILVLDEYIHWADDLPILDPEKRVKFVIYPDLNDDWMVQSVPVPEEGRFANRKALPEEWAGYRDTQLASITGVKDAIFCHKQRFIGGAHSQDGALRLAELALLS